MWTFFVSILKAIPWAVPFIKETLFGTREQRSRLWIAVLISFLLTALIFTLSGIKIIDYTQRAYAEATQYKIMLEVANNRLINLEKIMDDRFLTIKNLQAELDKATSVNHRYRDQVREIYNLRIEDQKKIAELEDKLEEALLNSDKNKKQENIKDRMKNVK